MGVRIISDNYNAALYCSTSDIAFGPVFYDEGDRSARERAESFLRFLGRDARQFTDAALVDLYVEWVMQEPEQWKKEEAEDVE
jgi:hypothetical protein